MLLTGLLLKLSALRAWIPLHWKAILTGLVCSAMFYAGYTVKGWIEAGKDQRELNAVIALQQEEQAKYDKLAKEYEDVFKKQRKENVALKRKIDNELTKSLYRECTVPDSGVQLLNEAITKKLATR